MESPTPAPTPRSAPELRQLLQEGLFEEEANRNLDKASVAYESLLQSFDQNRQFAATALFRLAEIRVKQNRKEDALALFKRGPPPCLFTKCEPLDLRSDFCACCKPSGF